VSLIDPSPARALRVVVVCNSFHACKKMSLLSEARCRGDAAALPRVCGDIVCQQFVVSLSKLYMGQFRFGNFVRRFFSASAAVCDGVVAVPPLSS